MACRLFVATKSVPYSTRTRWRLVKTLGQHQVGVNFPSHAQYQLWNSTILQNSARINLSWKFGESKCNPYWYITWMTSHGTNHVLNEHLDFSQHSRYATPSDMILWYSYPASFKNQTEILIELLNQRNHLTLIISLTIIKILANKTICNTITDNAMLQLSFKFDESKWNPYCVTV